MQFLGLESLTDEEWELVETSLVGVEADFNIETFNANDQILQFREETFTTRQRLKDLYSAKGIDVSPAPVAVPKSQIFIGEAL